MSAKRFADYVNANLKGKQIKSAFVAENGAVRVVFSDGSVVEIGIDHRLDPISAYPSITPAERVEDQTK